eukprot:CAMPEP_0197680218 /NCGR_PEP_ID=MMETSP1338-20131121/92968_1 /TAXON_ID=43686 ORGANISM="Pelagodinium beii, Strain RCC1491" /NCGR_SAMPLE_ID=MMETSP1338 /ASSEMBLY_ACC=CAM_ASM_000754 /LENGTH=35 /DNA_ID= /DNA_START= /DNA_END= /DNA_ORIENTATION=
MASPERSSKLARAPELASIALIVAPFLPMTIPLLL